MTFVRSAMILLLLVPVVCVAQVEHAGCLSYEPATDGVHGKLVRKTFAGPPNYHDTRESDEADTVWLVKLDRPICIKQDGAKPDLYPSQKNVRRVQLVLTKEDGERAKTLLGKRVVATGLLFAAHTGQYHMPVLLKVTYLDLPRWR
jgi:uncharacterized protein DUF4431